MNLTISEKYELIKEQNLGDIHSEGILLKHKKSGARVALISNDDENKVFSIAFRTPPMNSTGVPHILEHSVLCGSEKYPLKDPFVELVKGSMNTFLNAMTYPDKTVYPVASCNDKDFQNLMDVYLDAVFNTNIYHHDEIFRQEGWSYELNAKDDELTINGVVYNEMKGAFSSPDDVISRAVFNTLYPDTAYAVESGGDPDVIPELSYEEFLNFHRRYYHPSNSYIYLYGDMDFEEKLEYLDREYLSKYDRIHIESLPGVQTPFGEIHKETVEYPISDSESEKENTYLTYNRVIGDCLDYQLMQAFDVLDFCLLSAPGAPIEKALLEAGIGKDISAYFEREVKQPFISIMAKNADPEDADRFEEIIRNTLQEIVDKGIDRDSVLAAINYEEFRIREADFGRTPKGLNYGLLMLDSWLHDDNEPFLNLSILDQYEWMREQIDKGYFENLIDTYLLKNTHGSSVTGIPVKGLALRKEQELKDKLAAYKASLTDEEIEKLIADTEQLRAYQEEEEPEENLQKIPLLKREDLRKDALPYSQIPSSLSGTKILRHDYETNGIAYLRLIFEIPEIPEALQPYVSLLQNILGVIDTENYTYGDLFNKINMYTGGICMNLNTVTRNDFPHGYKAYMEVRGKTLYQEMPRLLEMMEEIIKHSRLEDHKRIKEIISQNVSRMQGKFLSAGHKAAVLRNSACRNEVGAFCERTDGISYYRFLSRLDQEFDAEKDSITEILQALIRLIFDKKNLLIGYTGSEESLKETESLLDAWQNGLYAGEKAETVKIPAFAEAFLKENGFEAREAFSSASKVQYVARTGNFEKKGITYHGAMHILRPILNYEYLWENIRVTGGAYGCMGALSRNGETYFVSYRDPHLARTDEIFKGIPEHLRKFDADERTMTKYIIGACSDMDMPLGPESLGNRSMGAYLSGVTFEQVQKERTQMLTAQPADIRALADAVEAALAEECICVVGGEEKIEEHKEMFTSVSALL